MAQRTTCSLISGWAFADVCARRGSCLQDARRLAWRSARGTTPLAREGHDQRTGVYTACRRLPRVTKLLTASCLVTGWRKSVLTVPSLSVTLRRVRPTLARALRFARLPRLALCRLLRKKERRDGAHRHGRTQTVATSLCEVTDNFPGA